MDIFSRIKFKSIVSDNKNSSALCIDLITYVSVMFLIREVYFSQFNFLTNGLFGSFSTLVTATILMRVRGVSWQEIGMFRPKTYKKALPATIFIVGFTVISISVFQMFKDQLELQIAPDTSSENAAPKFGKLSAN